MTRVAHNRSMNCYYHHLSLLVVKRSLHLQCYTSDRSCGVVEIHIKITLLAKVV